MNRAPDDPTGDSASSAPARPPRLSDGVIVCRRIGEDDLPRIVAICQDPGVARFTRIPSPYSYDDARAFLEISERGWEEGTDYPFAIADHRSDLIQGCCGVHRRDPRDGFVEIGYYVGPEARGRGVASRAVRLVSAWALQELRVPRIELMADVDNHGSIRVAEKAGYTREGVLRSRVFLAGEHRDAVLFSLLPTDLTTPRTA